MFSKSQQIEVSRQVSTKKALTNAAVEHYRRSYLNLLRDPSLISSISLDLSAPVHLPNTFSFIPNLFLKFSSSVFKFFYTW